MTFSNFISQFDKPGSIVLLEGKREVLESDAPKLVQIGALLVQQTTHITFRSGNAAGADELFCSQIAHSSPHRLQLITPYTNHRKKKAGYSIENTLSLDSIDLASEPELVYGSKIGNRNDKLIDSYTQGIRNRNTLKAAYLIRDTVKVIGTSTLPKADVALFYDHLSNPKQGGTGHTMIVCEQQQTPYFTQDVWFQWLNYY